MNLSRVCRSGVRAVHLFVFLLVATDIASSKSILNEFEIVDLTHEVAENYTLQWPTASRFDFKILARGDTDAGYYYEGNDFSQSEHSGTHTDAPAHFFKDRWRIGQIPLQRLVGPGVVINIKTKALTDRDAQLTVEDVMAWETIYGMIPENSIVLMNSGSSKHYNDPKMYFGYPDEEKFKSKDVKHLHFPGFHPDATKFLVDKRKIIGLGVDTPSTDYGQSKDFKTHQILGSSNVWGLENVANLDALPPKGFIIFNMVYKLKEGSGAPSRVIAQIPVDKRTEYACENGGNILRATESSIIILISFKFLFLL